MKVPTLQLTCLLFLLVPSLQATKHLRLIEPKEISSNTLDVLLILDTSSSVDSRQFSTLRGNLESWLSSDTTMDTKYEFRWALATFSDDLELLQGFTVHRRDIVTSLAGVTQANGGTNYAGALSAAAPLLDSANHRAIIIFTDGVIDNDPVNTQNQVGIFAKLRSQVRSFVATKYGNPTNATALLKKQGVNVFTVGVGSEVNLEVLSALASYSCSYVLRNDSAASDVQLELSALRAHLLDIVAPPTPAFKVNHIQFNKNVSIGENIPLTMSITNLGQAVPIGAVELVFDKNAYIDQTVVPLGALSAGQTKQLTVTLLVPTWKLLKELEEVVSYKFVDVATKKFLYCQTLGLKLRSENFIQSLLDYVPEDRDLPAVNIMAFGFKGAGKSSFINTAYTAISDQIQWYLPAGGKTEGTRTKELIRSPLWNSQHLPHIRVNFWDTWGTEDGHYTPELFSRILAGELPDGFKLSAWDSDKIPDAEAAEVIRKQREIHAVLFVVPPSIRQMPEAVKAILGNWDAALDRGLTPILIVTHADKILEADHERFQKAVAAQFLIPVERVRLVSNYVSEKEKNFAKDLNVISIFNLALKSASAYLSAKLDRAAICDPPCMRGTCENNQCNCEGTGYRGSACSIAICTSPCMNGGICVEPEVCDCANTNGHFGPRCMLDTKLIIEFFVGLATAVIGTVLMSKFLRGGLGKTPGVTSLHNSSASTVTIPEQSLTSLLEPEGSFAEEDEGDQEQSEVEDSILSGDEDDEEDDQEEEEDEDAEGDELDRDEPTNSKDEVEFEEITDYKAPAPRTEDLMKDPLLAEPVKVESSSSVEVSPTIPRAPKATSSETEDIMKGFLDEETPSKPHTE